MKLTDTQLLLLSKATQIEGLLVVPPNLNGAAAAKVIRPLLETGLIKEVPSQPDRGAWRRNEAEGQSYALVITTEGRAAINADERSKEVEQPEPPKEATTGRATARAAAKKVTQKKSAKGLNESDGSPRAGSKLAKVIGMLTSKAGTTIDSIVKATDWLPHTTRAALTGLRKRGYRIEKESREGGRTIYRIVGGATRRQHAAKKRRKDR
jgi:hypothetical protein